MSWHEVYKTRTGNRHRLPRKFRPRSFGKSLIPDPDRAAAVKQIFEDFATGQFTKQELLAQITRRGVRTRRGLPLSSQAFGTMLENPLYIGIVDVPDYGVRWKRGDFEPLITEEVFYRVQAVLAGRIQPTAPVSAIALSSRSEDSFVARSAAGG